MFKQRSLKLSLAVACALAASSCGLQDNLPLIGSDSAATEATEAEVEIVNPAGEPDGDRLSSSADDDAAVVIGNDDAEAAPTDDEATTPGGGPVVLGSATSDQIARIDGDGRASTNPTNLFRGWGYLTIDGALSTDQLEDDAPADGAVYLLIDYQILGADSGNFFKEAFRLEADGQSYSPLNTINEIIDPGEVFNDSVLFEVPATVTSMVLHAGSPEGSADGFASSYEITLTPGDREPVRSLSDHEIEATAGEIMLASSDPIMSTNPGNPTRGSGTLTIDAARTTAKIEQDGAGPDSKFVVVDYQLLGIDGGNFFRDAFRLQADGEWYSPLEGLNEIVDPGEVFNRSLLFRVPRHVDRFELEGGVPPQWSDGLTANYEIVFAPGTADDETSESAAEELSDADVDQEAGDITLATDDAEMSTNPGNPTRGAGTLTIDAARTTAKIEQDGAGPDSKFVVIDYQLVGVGGGNFFHDAFRLEAEGEWYSPLTGINEIVDPGEVFNGSLVFRIPRSTTAVTLEGGVVQGSPDGSTVRYDISFW